MRKMSIRRIAVKTDENCVFCKIASGEIPAKLIYEDEYCVAFPDMEPLMPVHTLIIPKDHYADVADDVPEELLGHLFKVVQKVVDLQGVHESGFRLLLNAGEDASQSVRHLHIHLLGGHKMPRPNDQDWSAEANQD